MWKRRRWGIVWALIGYSIVVTILYRKGRIVATKPRDWPYKALQNRDNAIFHLRITVANLHHVIEDGAELSQLEQLRCVSIAQTNGTNALRELEMLK